MCFKREVSRVLHVHLELWKVLLVSSTPGGWKDEIVLTPQYEGRRLIFAEKLRELKSPVVIEHVQLNSVVGCSVEPILIDDSGGRVEERGVCHTVLILPLRRVSFHQRRDPYFFLGHDL